MTGYEQDGYELIRQAIPPADLEPLRNRIAEQVGVHAVELQDAGNVSDLYEDAPFGQRMAALHAEGDFPLRSWNEPVFGPDLHALIRHSGIADALERNLGPNVSFNGDYHLRPKLPSRVETAFPLHRDSQYYGKPSRHAHIITVWIPLVDVDEVNGCLYVIPGSQRWDWIDSARDENSNMRSFEDVEKRGAPIPVPMKRGDILLLSNLTFHASMLNQSSSVRWSTDIRYCRTRGTYSATPLEAEGEDFLYEKLIKTGRPPFVVRGNGERMSFETWRDERAALKQRA